MATTIQKTTNGGVTTTVMTTTTHTKHETEPTKHKGLCSSAYVFVPMALGLVGGVVCTVLGIQSIVLYNQYSEYNMQLTQGECFLAPDTLRAVNPSARCEKDHVAVPDPWLSSHEEIERAEHKNGGGSYYEYTPCAVDRVTVTQGGNIPPATLPSTVIEFKSPVDNCKLCSEDRGVLNLAAARIPGCVTIFGSAVPTCQQYFDDLLLSLVDLNGQPRKGEDGQPKGFVCSWNSMQPTVLSPGPMDSLKKPAQYEMCKSILMLIIAAAAFLGGFCLAFCNTLWVPPTMRHEWDGAE